MFRHYNAKVFCMYMVNHEWNTRVNLLDNTHRSKRLSNFGLSRLPVL